MADQQDEMMGTKPIAEHKWLQNLVGDWTYETEFIMGEGEEAQTSGGTEKVTDLGGLFAHGENKGTMPGGNESTSFFALGYDVSFKEYRGVWFGSMSSHIWKSVGTLSADGKKMTLDCVGPSMTKDGESENYQDVHELIDANTRTMTSFGPGENGDRIQYMKSTYKRK